MINTLNEEATKYTASMFFLKKDEISSQMRSAMNSTLLTVCYLDIVSFALGEITVPQKFNDAVTET
jgi:hypothetical protein